MGYTGTFNTGKFSLAFLVHRQKGHWQNVNGKKFTGSFYLIRICPPMGLSFWNGDMISLMERPYHISTDSILFSEFKHWYLSSQNTFKRMHLVTSTFCFLFLSRLDFFPGNSWPSLIRIPVDLLASRCPVSLCYSMLTAP